MDTLTAIKALAAEQFGGDADTIDVDKPVDQLGIDSLGFLEFLFELEDRVAISIARRCLIFAPRPHAGRSRTARSPHRR